MIPSSARPISDPVAAWLLAPETRRLDAGVLVDQLARRLLADGVPLFRVAISIPTMHPQVFRRNINWTEAGGSIDRFPAHQILDTPTFLDSPVAVLYSGQARRLRFRLEGPNADVRYPILREIADLGATDYVANLIDTGTVKSYMSAATRAADGFADAHVARLIGLVDALGVWLELEAGRYTTRSLLEVYLGKSAAARVLGGDFKRGTGQEIRAAIWYCDMRGFTAIADRAAARDVVVMLDRFFEAVSAAIDARGGEILKFIGDAVLAIFPAGGRDPCDACERALAAAQAAVDAVARLNRESATGAAPLELGIALHLGDVMYGNVGGRERLDFTVIGAAVNEVCRVEALCKTLGAPILFTRAFADALASDAAVSAGRHALKGVSEPHEIFTLAKAT
jgi:adenylate cyclase